MQLRSFLVRLLLGNDIAELLQGYKPPQGKHNSLITGSPTSWAWGKGDHGSELDGLLDDDHTQYLINARHDVPERHPLSVLDPSVCSETECDNKIAAIPSDDVAATPSLRTLGSGAQQAAPGNHTHTLTVARAFYLANSKVTGTTSWVEMASTLIPSNAKKVIGWCFGSSDTSLKIGECRTLYNGVQKAYDSGAFYSITPVMWNDDGLGFAANLTIEIKKNVDANKIVYGYGADYVTT